MRQGVLGTVCVSWKREGETASASRSRRTVSAVSGTSMPVQAECVRERGGVVSWSAPRARQGKSRPARGEARAGPASRDQNGATGMQQSTGCSPEAK